MSCPKKLFPSDLLHREIHITIARRQFCRARARTAEREKERERTHHQSSTHSKSSSNHSNPTIKHQSTSRRNLDQQLRIRIQVPISHIYRISSNRSSMKCQIVRTCSCYVREYFSRGSDGGDVYPGLLEDFWTCVLMGER